MSLTPFLRSSQLIDFTHPLVAAKAKTLALGATSESLVVQRCFEFVRDEIQHSADYRLNPVTCQASEVLQHGTGFCYAKSHLLAALLRANGIAAGLCYQRLATGSEAAPYCLHGLNAVFLEPYGWYRLDPRGNKAGMDAQFCPPQERLAFAIQHPEEKDFPAILAEPLPSVVQALTQHRDWEDLVAHLPDMKQIESDQG